MEIAKAGRLGYSHSVSEPFDTDEDRLTPTPVNVPPGPRPTQDDADRAAVLNLEKRVAVLEESMALYAPFRERVRKLMHYMKIWLDDDPLI